MRSVHGGDIEGAARRLGRGPEALLDFSANINPAGPPAGVRTALAELAAAPELLARYPDPRYEALRARLAARDGVAPLQIAIGNGVAALIDAAVRALRPQRCILPGPSFSEYRKVLQQAQIETVALPLASPAFRLDVESLAALTRAADADLVILANPNNPTGMLLDSEAVCELSAQLPSNTILLLDEAFVDYAPTFSVVGAGLQRTIVLRSLTKFYALPGARVGYAVAPPTYALRIEDCLPSWSVGTLDARVALAALDDPDYEERARRDNEHERRFLRTVLQEVGLTVVDSAANFLLCQAAALWQWGSAALAERLAVEAGILVRSCEDYPELAGGCWIRVAVRSRAENTRLVRALRAILST